MNFSETFKSTVFKL